jgi:hypothetical protein
MPVTVFIDYTIDTDFIAADKLRTDTSCVRRWDSTLMRPLV